MRAILVNRRIRIRAVVPLKARVVCGNMINARSLAGKMRQHADQQPFVMIRQIIKRQPTLGLRGSPPPDRDQLRQPSIRRSIGRPQQRWQGVIEDDFCADDQFEVLIRGLGFSRRFIRSAGSRVCSDDTGEGIFVGDRECLVSQFDRTLNQLVGVGSAREE